MNWGVIVAALASFVFGWLFYSPLLFGNVWLKYSGIDKNKAKKSHSKGMGGKLLTNFIASMITAWVLLGMMNAFGATGSMEIVSLVWKIWLGFFASTTLIGAILWEDKRLEIFFLNGLYWLLNLGIMAFVLNSI